MTHLTDLQIEGLLSNAGFPQSAIPTFVAIAHAESGGNTDALNDKNTNGTADYGLFQINSAGGFDNSRLYDPVYNTQAAYSLYSRRGTQPWDSSKSRWSKEVTNNSGGVSGAFQKGMQPWKDLFTGHPNKIGKDLSTAANDKTTVGSVLGDALGLNKWQQFLYDILKYVALFLLGLMFLIIGFVLVFRKPIEKVAPIAAAV